MNKSTSRFFTDIVRDNIILNVTKNITINNCFEYLSNYSKTKQKKYLIDIATTLFYLWLGRGFYINSLGKIKKIIKSENYLDIAFDNFLIVIDQYINKVVTRNSLKDIRAVILPWKYTNYIYEVQIAEAYIQTYREWYRSNSKLYRS